MCDKILKTVMAENLHLCFCRDDLVLIDFIWVTLTSKCTSY